MIFKKSIINYKQDNYKVKMSTLSALNLIFISIFKVKEETSMGP